MPEGEKSGRESENREPGAGEKAKKVRSGSISWLGASIPWQSVWESIRALAVPLLILIFVVVNARESRSGSLDVYPSNVVTACQAATGAGTEPDPNQVPAAPAHTAGTEAGIDGASPVCPHGSSMTLKVEGTVLSDWSVVEGARVWALVEGRNEYLVGDAVSDADGAFAVEAELPTTEESRLDRITLHAGGGRQGDAELGAVDGETMVKLSDWGVTRQFRLPGWPAFVVPILFGFSIWLGLVRAEQKHWRRVKHMTSVALALCFTLAMIAAIISALGAVNTEGKQGEILALRYGYLFQGHYAEETQSEWIFSFTSPESWGPLSPASSSGAAAKAGGDVALSTAGGFGAPLWVILMSVFGAAIATVSLIVNDVKETVDYGDEAAFRQRIQSIVLHQFYILFAPLGAVFVYQMLVAGDAAGKSTTVAVTALGAGPALNYIVDLAIKRAHNLFSSEKNTK